MKTELFLDASLLKQSACLRRVYYQGIKGYNLAGNKSPLIFGSALHKFFAAFYETGDADKGIMEAATYMMAHLEGYNDDFRTMGLLMDTCNKYVAHYRFDQWTPLKIGETTYVEKRFVFPYYEDSDFIVYLCGTVDLVAYDGQSEGYLVVDHKTSSSPWPDKYLDEYTLSPQLMTYVFVLNKYIGLPDSPFAKIKSVGALINGIFYNKKGKEENRINFKRSQAIYFTDERLKEFEAGVDHFVARLVEAKRTGNFPREGLINGSCHAGFGCDYVKACSVMREDVSNDILTSPLFDIRQYNPLTFGE